MGHETRRPSSLPNPPCGFARYHATREDPGVLVEITFVDGDQIAIVREGEDAGEEVPIEGMPGEFRRLE